ncbi:hypothetical protein [Sedimentibacter sp.]|uniref:hypothetical protein n=1 Tax=Sedimentibacter sp. TaxID=1960295 RepID=UPI0028B11884|nr:hypothetical protein [Sedimentibacter sp.]
MKKVAINDKMLERGDTVLNRIYSILLLLCMIFYLLLPMDIAYASEQETKDIESVEYEVENGDIFDEDEDPKSGAADESYENDTEKKEPPVLKEKDTESIEDVEDIEDIEKQEGYIYSFEELKDWFRENSSSEVTLGADIIVPKGEEIHLRGFGDTVCIHTGDYGIIIEGNLTLSYHVNISGTGISQPVIEVKSGGKFELINISYDVLSKITATGENGCALVFREGSRYSQSSSHLEITAMDGTAVESEIPIEAERWIIRAETGIVSGCDVSLLLCIIEAQIAADAPEVIADTCILPETGRENITEIRRSVMKMDNNNIRLNIGAEESEYLREGWMSHAVLSADGYEDIEVLLDYNLLSSQIDTSTEGIYYIPIELNGYLSSFGLIDESVPLFTAEVRNMSIPVFDSAVFAFNAYFVDYLYVPGSAENSLKLWRSDDEGESWYDCTDETPFKLFSDAIRITFYEPSEQPVWLVWEVTGVGESEILRLTWDGEVLLEPMEGGDRNGGDRGEVKPPAAPKKPSHRPETTPKQASDTASEPKKGGDIIIILPKLMQSVKLITEAAAELHDNTILLPIILQTEEESYKDAHDTNTMHTDNDDTDDTYKDAAPVSSFSDTPDMIQTLPDVSPDEAPAIAAEEYHIVINEAESAAKDENTHMKSPDEAADIPPYSDSNMPLVIVGGISLAAAAAYFVFRQKQVKRQ